MKKNDYTNRIKNDSDPNKIIGREQTTPPLILPGSLPSHDGYNYGNLLEVNTKKPKTSEKQNTEFNF